MVLCEDIFGYGFEQLVEDREGTMASWGNLAGPGALFTVRPTVNGKQLEVVLPAFHFEPPTCSFCFRLIPTDSRKFEAPWCRLSSKQGNTESL